MKKTETKSNEKSEKFVENVDYFFENGLMVLTAHFLLKRGYCCGNGCRHCPYPKQQSAKS
ncbi:MAG: DUF5522 domain-containing protein [Pyrinomonadaceae bacterium]